MKNGNKIIKHLISLVGAVGIVISMFFSLIAEAASLSGLDDANINVSYEGTAGWTVDGTTITGEFSGSSVSSTLTISCDKDATISFDYSISVTGAPWKKTSTVVLTAGNQTDTASSTGGTTSYGTTDTNPGAVSAFSLADGNTVTIVVTLSASSDFMPASASITISDIQLALAGGVQVTLNPAAVPSNLSYTVNHQDASKNDTSTTVATAPVTPTIELTGGLTIPAVTSGSDKYVCVKVDWTNGGNSGTYYPDDSGYFMPVAGDVLTPYFAKVDSVDSAPFKVGTKTYWTWETAFTAAGSGGTVVLNSNYTLPTDLAGNGLAAEGTYVKYNSTSKTITYIVPSGVTFLIPYDSAHTGLATVDGSTKFPQVVDGVGNTMNSANFPYAYENGTLTVGANTTIQSSGTFIVNGKQWATDLRDTGSACGPHGLVELTETTSKINIQAGSLFCYGFIIGDGVVEVNDNASVYELFQLTDWRGFTATLSWMGENVDTSDLTSLGGLFSMLSAEKIIEKQQTNRSFVFNQYYVQNIEADIKLNVGANQYVMLAMNTKEEMPQFELPFVSDSGGDGFLKLSGSGALLRSYDAATDRTTYTIGCDIITGSISITFGVKISILSFSGTIYSQYNIFPLSSNLSFIIPANGSLTIANDMKLMPEATIDVQPGGELILAEGVEFYLYDKADWLAGSYAYSADYHRVNYVASNHSSGGKPFARVIDESSKLNIDGTLTINSGANLFTTAGYTRNGASTVADAGNTDKLVTGTGKIVNNGTTPDVESAADFGKLDEFEFSGSFTIAHEIETVPFVAKLSGVTDGTTYKYNSFATGTYYGLGSACGNYWYQYYVKAVDENGASATANITDVPTLASAGVSASKTVSRYNSTEKAQDTISNVAGLVSNYLTAYSTTDSDGATVTMYQSNQSAFSFKVSDGYDVYLNSVADANKLTPTDGTYTLNGIAADATLVLVEQSTGATYYVTITWKQTSTATYTPAQTTYTWSPTELKYTANEAKWTGTSVMKITIDNTNSTGAVNANFTYSPTDITQSYKWDESSTDAEYSIGVAEKVSADVKLTVTPTGTPTTTDSEIILGTITITLSKEE